MVLRMDLSPAHPGTPAAFARVVDEAIRAANLSNVEAAERTGIARETLNRKRAGKGKPFDAAEQKALADLLGTTVSALWKQAEGVAA